MSATFPHTDADGNPYRIDSHGNKLYGTSPQQTNVNESWVAYWNGEGERPLEGTYFTGTGPLAKEAPDAVSQQAALDFYGGTPTAPTPTTATVSTTTSLLDFLSQNNVNISPNSLADAMKLNGGKSVLDAGSTGVLPPPNTYNYQHGQPSTTPSTNALNAAAGAGQGARGASSVFPKINPQTGFSNLGTGTPPTTPVPMVRGRGGAFTPTVPAPVNTGFPYQNPVSAGVVPSVNPRDERNYLLATDLPTDKYALQRIEEVKTLRALTNSGGDFPESIPLQVATLTWGEQGINTMLNSVLVGGRWAIEGQFLVWKPDSITPTPESNSSPWNGIYQIPQPNTGGGGGSSGGGGGASYGNNYAAPVALGVLNLRLSTG